MTCEWIEPATGYERCEFIDTAREISILSEVVGKDLCCSCGVCVGLCPTNALSMKLKANGDLTPHLVDERCLDKCRVCLDVCPFSQGVHDPRETSKQLFSVRQASIFDENIGWYINSIVGFRCDEKLRKASASGGLATWCMEKLLRAGIVTRIAVVRLAKNQDNGFFEFFSVSTIEDLRRSSGSIYHPVEISGIIREIASIRQERWAIVGVPCLCSAIRNIGHLQNKIPFVFGLSCGMYQNTFYTEMLLAKSGVDRKNIVSINYRRKSIAGPASDYRFHATDSHVKGKEVAYRGLPFFLGKNAYFRQNACNYCKDVFAEASDACFMDAWLPEYASDPRGTSLVVIRNRTVNDLFKRGCETGELYLKEITADQVVQSQVSHIHRKKKLIKMRLKDKETEYTLPEKFDWWLQQKIQKRSKKAWAKYGRRYGRFVFWLTLIDILLIHIILTNTVKIAALSKRCIGRFGKTLVHNK